MNTPRKPRARTLLKAKAGVAGMGLVAAVSMTACNLAVSYLPEDADFATPKDMKQVPDQSQGAPDQSMSPADLASMPDKA